MGGYTVLCLSVLVLYFVTADSYVIVVRVPDASNSVETENNLDKDVTLIEEDSSKLLIENWYNWYNLAPSNEADTICGTTDKDYKYFESTQSCYKIHTERESWHDAEAACSREGGHLAVINSREEREILAGQFPSGFRVVHIGLYWVQDYQIWMTTSGHTLAETGYAYGGVGEPNNLNGNQHCGSMYPEGSFDNIACSDKTAFICEKIMSFPHHQDTTTKAETTTDTILDDSSEKQETESSSEPNSVEDLNECGTTDSEYIFYANTQSCYKFHDEKVTWDDAEATCVREGGHLAVTNSQNETDFFKTLFPLDSYTLQVFLGYYKQNVSWVTSQGKTVTESGYGDWQNGEPINDYPLCGTMYRGGTLNDCSCDFEIAFICQKNQNSQFHSAATEPQNNLDTTEKSRFQSTKYFIDYDVADTSEAENTSDTESQSKPTPIDRYAECEPTDPESDSIYIRCFKIHTEERTWTEAQAICVSEGGHLAIVSDQQRQWLIQDIPPGWTMVWLGDGKDDSWKTKYGVTEISGQRCTAMYYDGTTIESPCNYRTYFVCEKDHRSQSHTITTTEAETDFETTETVTDTTINQDELLEVQSQSTEAYNECGTDTEYEFLESTKQCYKVHTDRAMWIRAEATCVREGGHLAVINSQDEADFLSSLFPRRSYQVFLGFHRDSDTWVTIQGENLSETGYEKWNEGEPNNADGDQDCGSMYPGGTFDDINCYLGLAFICEKNSIYKFQPDSAKVQNSFEASDTVADDDTLDDVQESSGMEDLTESALIKSANECGTTDTEYTFYKITGSCYKVHTDRKKWNDAEETCVREGGHLAVINSQDEADVLSTMYPEGAMHVFVGFSYRELSSPMISDMYEIRENGVWLTINGETLAEAGYENWTPGEPNNAGGREYCGTIYGNGKFDDSACYNRFNYICEIPRN